MPNFMHNWAQKWASERPRQYTMIWVTFWDFCSVANRAVQYGWNVWVDQLFTKFYGDVEYTMARGGPVFAFSLLFFTMGIGNFMITFTGLQNPKKTFTILGFKFRGGRYRAFYIMGLISSTISFLVMGLAVQYTQLWLLYIACAAFGFCGAFMQPIGRYAVMMSYYAVGQKGLGSGLHSAFTGVWAATFSYWGTALSDNLSIQSAIYISAAVGAVTCLVSIPFMKVVVPNHSKYHVRSKQRLERAAELAKTEVIHPVHLSVFELLRTPQIWIMWFAMFVMLIPGTATQYLISPMLASVYDASRSVQNLASLLFMILFAIARLVGGALNYLFDAMVLMRVMISLTIPALILQGWLATQYDSSAALYGFIACECFLGAILGASKVLLTLLCFRVFGAINFMNSLGLLWSCFGTASLVGPIFGWWSLSGHGVSTDPNFRSSLGDAVAILCYAFAGSQVFVFIMSFFIINVDFAKYQHPKEASSNGDPEEAIDESFSKSSRDGGDETESLISQDEMDFCDDAESPVNHAQFVISPRGGLFSV